MLKPNGIVLGLGLWLWTGCTPPAPKAVITTPPMVSRSPVTATPSAFLPGLPEDVKDYTQWLKVNTAPIPPNSSAPHTPSQGNKNIFVNQSKDVLAAGGQVKYPFPNGTVIVKEALHKDNGYVELIAIMRKIDQLDPEHGNWQFHEYTRSAPDQAFTLAFKDATCFSCHAVAKDRDFVRFSLQVN